MEKGNIPASQAKKSAPVEKTSAAKGTETAKTIRQLVKKIYRQANEYKAAGKPVAWCMGQALQQDVLAAMDVASCYPENYAGLCATKRVEMPYLEKAESDGWARYLCGYSRLTLGYSCMRHELGMTPPDAPDGGMADPDMLICSSNLCEPRYKWFQALARYMNTPIHCTDVVIPPCDRDLKALEGYYLDYQVKELRELVSFVEKVLGKKMDWDKLAQSVANSFKTMELAHEVYELRKAVPCPMPSEDWWAGGGPLFEFTTFDPDTVNFFISLRDELKEKVKNKIGVIPEEKYRLLWAGLPPWHNMQIFNYFESLGAVVVAELTYYVSWHPGIGYQVEIKPGSDPLEAIALSNFKRWTTWHDEARRDCDSFHSQMILDLIRDYKVDGFVAHMNNSCRVVNFGHTHASALAKERYGIPTLMLQSDIIDTRDYSDAQMKQQIDNFIETLESSKKERLSKGT